MAEGEFYIEDTWLRKKLKGLEDKLDELESKLDSLQGRVSQSSGSVIASWQSGTAASGEPGADLVNIGFSDTNYKIHSLVIDISELTDGAAVIVKLLIEVNSIEKKVYSQSFAKGADPDGLWIVNGTLSIQDVLRVEVHSDNAGDNGKAVAYDYMLEATQ